MEAIPTDVQCYSGYQPSPKGYGLAGKADKSPRRFLLQDEWIEVDEVLESWVQAERDLKKPQAGHFKVRGNDGHDYLLRHDLAADVWFIENRW